MRMRNNRKYRSLSKIAIIPSGVVVRILRKLKVPERKPIWTLPLEDKKQIISALVQQDIGPNWHYGNEQQRVHSIRAETKKHNKNNLTRTAAYLDYFNKHPEVHWVLLAHMVSRNAGYHMTDLAGEFLPRLLTKEQCKQIYLSLERANSLIFQDVYPQLLLYEESKTTGGSCFHLLNAFHVSAFMKPVWEHFLRNQDSIMMTIALILNEQHFIEERVVKNDAYSSVFKSIPFSLQNLLQLTKIVFPVMNGKMRLTGLSVSGFHHLARRIQTGKTLYGLLFEDQILPGVKKFVNQQPHTGSRKDYWNKVFTDDANEFIGDYSKERIRFFSLKKRAPRLYSPKLLDGWDLFLTDPPMRGDWFSKEKGSIPSHLEQLHRSKRSFIDLDYWSVLHQLEGAVLAKNLFSRDE